MKTIAYASIFALFLISLAIPWSTNALASGPTASGSYGFVSEDGLTKQVEFEARLEGQGATGQMTFRDEAGVVEYDPDNPSEIPKDPPSEFFMRADLDSLTIESNRALMSGTVRDSSNQSYIGKWVQLVVEDNGDGRELSDKLSWCLCQPEEGGWVPSDAEVKDDEGAWYKWWATDEEVRDDAGIPSKNIIPGNKKNCETFLLSAYEFAEMRSGEGQIQVQP